MSRTLCTALIGLLLLAACGQTSGTDSGPRPAPPDATVPVGVVWKWTGAEGADPAVVGRPALYTIEFLDDGRYSVRADCNSGAGEWGYEDGTLSLQAGPMTLAACGPTSLESRYLDLLAGARGFAHEDGRLTLFTGDATRMEFEAMREISLAGTSWLVRAYNNGRGGAVSVHGGSELHMAFGEDGTVTGSAGCNRFDASYHLEGDSLTVGPVATTRRLCPPEEIMEQESAFLAALESARAWEIRGGRAQLRRADGALAVDLVAAVTGTVVRGEGPALPRGAVLRIELLDVTKADAMASVVGEQTLALQGQAFPVRFEVEFDPTDIEPTHRYSVRATIAHGTELLYTTTSVHPVLTLEHARYGIELDLEPVQG